MRIGHILVTEGAPYFVILQLKIVQNKGPLL